MHKRTAVKHIKVPLNINIFVYRSVVISMTVYQQDNLMSMQLIPVATYTLEMILVMLYRFFIAVSSLFTIHISFSI